MHHDERTRAAGMEGVGLGESGVNRLIERWPVDSF
jgi:hypothetical protein